MRHLRILKSGRGRQKKRVRERYDERKAQRDALSLEDGGGDHETRRVGGL